MTPDDGMTPAMKRRARARHLNPHASRVHDDAWTRSTPTQKVLREGMRGEEVPRHASKCGDDAARKSKAGVVEGVVEAHSRTRCYR